MDALFSLLILGRLLGASRCTRKTTSSWTNCPSFALYSYDGSCWNIALHYIFATLSKAEKMSYRSINRFRKVHRFLGIFIGIQFLFWTVSGLYFSWTNIDEIHGDHYQKETSPNPVLPPYITATVLQKLSFPFA